MKLHHRMLRHFIAASVIVLTSSFLIFELVASDRVDWPPESPDNQYHLNK